MLSGISSCLKYICSHNFKDSSQWNGESGIQDVRLDSWLELDYSNYFLRSPSYIGESRRKSTMCVEVDKNHAFLFSLKCAHFPSSLATLSPGNWFGSRVPS